MILEAGKSRIKFSFGENFLATLQHGGRHHMMTETKTGRQRRSNSTLYQEPILVILAHSGENSINSFKRT
jgi:hypothetical protein